MTRAVVLLCINNSFSPLGLSIYSTFSLPPCSTLSLSLTHLQSDTEFWDKMQAEWEELARRNWLTENEQAQIPPNVSPHEKVTIIKNDTDIVIGSSEQSQQSE